MVVARFHVSKGSEPAFELAFLDRPRRSGPRPPVQEVHFGRPQEDLTRYLRVSIWRSLNDWNDFQGGGAQQAFRSMVRRYLRDDPQVEFYDLVGNGERCQTRA